MPDLQWPPVDETMKQNTIKLESTEQVTKRNFGLRLEEMMFRKPSTINNCNQQLIVSNSLQQCNPIKSFATKSYLTNKKQRKHHKSSSIQASIWSSNGYKRRRQTFFNFYNCIHTPNLLRFSIITVLIFLLVSHRSSSLADAISIRPADFDRLIMPCYHGAGVGSSYSNFQQTNNYQPAQSGPQAGPLPPVPGFVPLNGYSSGQQFASGRQANVGNNPSQPAVSSSNLNFQPPSYYAAPDSSGRQGGQASGSFLGSNSNGLRSGGQFDSANNLNNLGQTIPRANTIDNFIALIGKIEAANPRLANNPDQLIRSLLGRFRMDNYYYDARSRTPISDPDRRNSDIIPALFNGNSMAGGNYLAGGQQQQQYMGGDMFPEQLLDHDEKCSMYFMLSHFIDKKASNSPSLGQMPILQLSGPQMGQRAPNLQAAGSGYPAQSANSAFGGGGSSSLSGRFPGPSPSFGSPATSQMNAFGTGINNQPDYLSSSSNKNNPFGVNTIQPLNQFNQQVYPRPAVASGNSMSSFGQFRSQVAPYVDASSVRNNQRDHDNRIALEYGVVGLANQADAGLVLNRVLMGLLAATTPPQTIRQLAAMIYPQTQQIMLNTPKLDDELDPLYAVTLADLWAISSIPKAGKDIDLRMLGNNGRWNDAMCPTSFTLDRSNSIRFTTAELLGGLDGFNLGMFRRRLISMRKNIRLSEMLRMYYSRSGFRPQFGDVGVCNRQAVLLSNMDDLHRQAEIYSRLYQLNLPTPDNEIAKAINGLDAFRDTLRQFANQFTPQDICQESSQDSLYPMNPMDQCEIARTDVVSVLDTSTQANDLFMQLVVVKLAQKLGLSRLGSSLSIVSNQQDSTGGGNFGLNVILRNSTNTAEIGCALAHDTSQSYQGGQISDPTRLMEMFERALVLLDSEYLTRQMESFGSQAGSGNYPRHTYVSSWFGQSGSLNDGVSYSSGGYMAGGGPSNTGGAKVILWFNYGLQTRPSQLSGSPTNWNGPSSTSSSQEQYQYKFYEAKKYLRENFRGASILALATNRDDVKSFVYDEDRDIFTDIPPASGSSISSSIGQISSSSSDFYPSSSADPSSLAMLSGPADQLVGKLMHRMCNIPAVFQYPMCYRLPSDQTVSVGYITPGRRQYWMMAPKTFFASKYVRLVFKVEGGRLRVCFGRKPNPDETAQRNTNQQSGQSATNYQISSGSISLGNQNGQLSQSQQSTPAPQPSSNDYYTGREYGVCKDVSQGQEIDFMISEPCYRKSIAECEPFYFVIRETSNPGEGDPNYMCREEGCKRFDQAKFVMLHTGVSCSSAFKGIQANQLLIILMALLVSIVFAKEQPIGHHDSDDLDNNSDEKKYAKKQGEKRHHQVPAYINKWTNKLIAIPISFMIIVIQQAQAQQANVYDYGQNRYGEKRGNYTPPEVLSIILVIMVIIGGLALTIGLCYYVAKRAKEGLQSVSQTEY